MMVKYVRPMVTGWPKELLKASIRALLYTPTFAAGGHGVAILPGGFAIVMSESRHMLYVLPLPVCIFVVSVIVTLWRRDYDPAR
ncbi:hypothetical protein QWI17_03760 [Gilvimarinus sp. SDUM040013]|uniref:Uncharacterized protein n=1 Tax=Gilvimarinus gilvus TaxID=3058038 RepID=A0ABU4S272_9GAMM|nr:hypothetical protein [Gilvimarinus sp. SDUM040013]MDO3384954.1 hypothetical protein [Gilvimarinus sp. SDUM040013]MDX6851250.1 hypothetical protein [Gilvimarinus sp. SDUM040013]